MNNVGANIKRIRKEKNLTQKELAEFVGVSTNSITRYETGIRSLDVEVLQKMAKALEVSVTDLLEETNKDRGRQYENRNRQFKNNEEEVNDMKNDMNVIGRLVMLHKTDRDYLEYLKDVLDDFGAYVDIINKQENLAVVGKYSLSKEDYRFEVETLDRHRRMIHNNIIRGIKNINRMCKEDNLPIFYDGSEGDRVEIAEFVFKCVEKNFKNRRL